MLVKWVSVDSTLFQAPRHKESIAIIVWNVLSMFVSKGVLLETLSECVLTKEFTILRLLSCCATLEPSVFQIVAYIEVFTYNQDTVK